MPVSRSKTTRNCSRGRRQQRSTASSCSPVNASGNGVAARAFNARARTLRNWPDSPASNPGGVKRSHRGSDNRSATAASINPLRAQNRSSSHTAVKIAFTVVPERARPARVGVTSTQCLNRASSASSMRRQSTPAAAHHPRNNAARPA
jgi:hypothetical protein